MATSAWSASDAAANAMTLSNGGLTVTSNPIGGAWTSIRSSISKTTGKLYVEFVVTVAGSDDRTMWGLASAGSSVSGQLGVSPYSCAAFLAAGANYVTAGFTSNYAVVPTINNGDVVGMAVDFGAGSVWFAKNNIWANSSNPATATLPMFSFVPATVGALFAGASFYAAGNVEILQSTAATQKYAPPSGFSAWDAPPPTGSVWSASDAAANAMTLSNGGLTVTSGAAVNKSIRGTVSQTTGKVYVEFSVVQAGSGNDIFGLASAGFNSGGKLGVSNYSCGIGYLQVVGSSGFTANISNSKYPVNGDTWAIAADFTAGKIWIAQNNVWLTSSLEKDPASGAAPAFSFVPATVGALFPALTIESAGNVYVLQATAASQKYALPAGFSAWDASAVVKSAQARVLVMA